MYVSTLNKTEWKRYPVYYSSRFPILVNLILFNETTVSLCESHWDSFFCHFPFRLGYGNMLSFPVTNLFIFSNLPSLVAQMVKNLPAMQETQVWTLGWKDPLEEGMETHSSILAWRIPKTEEPGGLQSKGLQRVGHEWETLIHTMLRVIP